MTGKKITAILLMVNLLLSCIPVRQSRAETTHKNGITYYYHGLGILTGDKSLIEITGVVVPKSTTVLKIPETLDGKKVISIELYQGVELQEGGDKVRIKRLVLSKNIRPMATAEKTRKKYIKYFEELPDLESIEVASDSKYLKAKDGVLYNKNMSSMLEYPSCKKSQEYKMPSSVIWSTGISNRYLKKIVFSDNKKYTRAYIGWCENLESVYFPDNIKSVGGCSGEEHLKTIRWSKNLETIEDGSFDNLRITRIKLPGKVREIGSDAFRWSSLKEVILPDGLRQIGGDAFGRCLHLEKVTIPESVAYVGRYAFAKTPALNGIKKAPYLLSRNNSKIKGKIPEFYKYIAIATLTKGKKKKYYNFQRIQKLKPLVNETIIGIGGTKTVTVNAAISKAKLLELYETPDLPVDLPRETFVKKGWKLKTDILSFTLSNPKVAKVTSKGKIKGLKRGKATITVQMKTSDVKCRIKVKVK